MQQPGEDLLRFLGSGRDDVASRSDVVDESDALSSERYVFLAAAGQDVIEDCRRERRRPFSKIMWPLTPLFGEGGREHTCQSRVVRAVVRRKDEIGERAMSSVP